MGAISVCLIYDLLCHLPNAILVFVPFEAEKFYFGGLVLIAPFLSLRDALGQQLASRS